MKEQTCIVKTIGKRILSMAILLIIIASSVASTPARAATYERNPVTTFSALQAAIDAFNNGSQDMEIEIGASFRIDDSMTITNVNAALTLRSSAEASAPLILRRGFSGPSSSSGIFILNKNTELILENIIIDGEKSSYDNTSVRLVTVRGGTLTLGNNAVLRNNNGGGVGVFDSGTLTMNGGEISGNTAAFFGGGVFVSDSTFTMTAGEIKGNDTSSATAASSRYGAGGGGVYVRDGTYVLHGGKISGNTASNYASLTDSAVYGGGVSVINSTFTMHGGEISNNTAKFFGAGVYLDAGTFTMNGGEISGNGDASANGGGVYVYRSTSTFTMNNGKISGNTASQGGGVGIQMMNTNIIPYKTFTMNGGEISGNTATSGGGVYAACTNSTFAMNGGRITGNTAASGGGVYIDVDTVPVSNTTDMLTLGGSAVISNNTRADGAASNVYLPRGRYIELNTGAATPGAGMNVWVTTATAGGVIVESGASAAQAAYFRADESGKVVAHSNGQLMIVDASTSLPTDQLPSEEAPNLVSATDAAWARDGINEAYSIGLVPEALQSTYRQVTTRAEFCALAVALYETVTGGEITEQKSFIDTSDVNVEKMAALEVVNGIGGNMFAPDDALTRQQAAAMISRLANAINKPLAQHAATFADISRVAPYAIEAVGQMQLSGIMGGVGDNTFAPEGAYTREQSIVTMLRLYDIVK